MIKLLSQTFLFLFFLMATGLTKAQDSIVIPLWRNGAPGFENLKDKPEEAKDYWVKNVNNPSVTVYPAPASNATGTAVLICPGGGHRLLVFNAEGIAPAKFLNSIGITAFVLKYRLFREDNSPYREKNAKEDVFRAMRLIKSVASQFKIDTSKIGIMGFSAGGELAGWLSYHYHDGYKLVNDNIDMLSAKPSFQVLIYPGPLVVPASVSADAPTTFLTAANDDTCCSPPVIQLLLMHRQAHVPVELHLYSHGNHAFNMGTRSTFVSLRSWPQRLQDWLQDSGFLK
jgi:acetyl esterase/lipase